MAEKQERLYRDQNTGAERRSSTRMGYPYVLVVGEDGPETVAKPKSGNGRRKKQTEAEIESEQEPEK